MHRLIWWAMAGAAIGFARPLGAQAAMAPPWSPATAKLSPSGPGMEASTVFGDPAGAGVYTLALRLKDGAWIDPHSHPKTKQVIVIEGVLLMGHGDTVEPARARAVGAGQVVVVEAGTVHYEGARGETVILLSGEGPLVTNWVRPPRKP
jgi:quercetin dioxygenase-like cupin family protein